MQAPVKSDIPDAACTVDVTQVASQAYTVSRGDVAADGQQVTDLWQRGLTMHGRHADKFAWYYRQAVEGTPEIFFLNQAGTAVGVAAVGPRRMQLDGKHYMGGILIDFVTMPAHRIFFPAMLLQREVHHRALKSHDVLFGFPNAAATPIVRRTGYCCVGQQIRRARVIRSARYLQKVLPENVSKVFGSCADYLRLILVRLSMLSLPEFKTAWLDRADDRFDSLWSRIQLAGVLIGVRDRRFLNWRFSECPFQVFKYFCVFSPDQKLLLAYAVCESDGDTLYVHDFLVASDTPSARRHLWLDLVLEASRLGYVSVSVSFMGSSVECDGLAKAGYVVRGERAVFADMAERLPRSQVASWYLTGADDDS